MGGPNVPFLGFCNEMEKNEGDRKKEKAADGGGATVLGKYVMQLS